MKFGLFAGLIATISVITWLIIGVSVVQFIGGYNTAVLLAAQIVCALCIYQINPVSWK